MGEAGRDPVETVARAVGDGVGFVVGTGVERLEDAALRLLGQLASDDPESPLLVDLRHVLLRLRARTSPLPEAARRAASAATYLGLRMGVETSRAAATAIRETNAFMGGRAATEQER